MMQVFLASRIPVLFYSIYAAIEELDLEEEDYIQIQELVFYSAEPQKDEASLRAQFGNLLEELKAQGYVGENPLQHWEKNRITCKLEIKNPSFTIEDKPIKHHTPQAKESSMQHLLTHLLSSS